MGNKNIDVALNYHSATNHSPQSVNETSSLDPANRPLPYKIYPSLAPIPLSIGAKTTSDTLFDALTHPTSISGEQIPDMQALAQLCFFSNGITKILKIAGREYPMRAAASTGALFHIEIYLVCGDLPDLPAGVYHYGSHDNALRQLRAGDFRRVLVDDTASEPSIVSAPVIAIYTSTFWRNAYKYRARAYRHTFWDGGTILANSLTISNALSLPTRIVLGFVDEQVNALLDIDGTHEAAISLLSFGHTEQIAPEAPIVLPLSLPTAQLSASETAYPLIETMHQNSSLTTSQEVMDWRNQSELSLPQPVLSTEPLIPLQPIGSSALPVDSVESVIRRRGSTRRFTHETITFAQLSTLLAASLQSIPFDCLRPETALLNSVYVIANAVEHLEHGTYVLHAEQQALERLQTGTFRHVAQFLSLDQDLGGDAAVNIYFLIDLAPVLAHFGNRGYRLAQIEAAITAGKMYLAAYGLSLGATGLTFFDNDVITFFSPHAANSAVMFLMAFGHPTKKRK